VSELLCIFRVLPSLFAYLYRGELDLRGYFNQAKTLFQTAISPKEKSMKVVANYFINY